MTLGVKRKASGERKDRAPHASLLTPHEGTAKWTQC
jgi:hypothetical protein